MNIDEFINEYEISHFYHFSDNRNVDSIKRNGLLSLHHLKSNKIHIPAPGGNEWSHEEDERRGLDKFVHLCFFYQHPMEHVAKESGHVLDTTFLKISTDVLFQDGIRFTKGVANKSNSTLLTFEEALTELDFEVLYRHLDWKDPIINARLQAAKKHELLIPDSIDPQYIIV